jgi:coenzyme PQQ synthesis protein D (PqqD)
MVREGHSSSARRECSRGFPQGAVLMLSFAGRAAAPAHVLVRFLDRESVLLNLETERYFGLDETGTRMWQLATDSPSIDVAYEKLLVEFDVEPELLRSNLSELLNRLVENGLLQVFPANVGTAQTI